MKTKLFKTKKLAEAYDKAMEAEEYKDEDEDEEEVFEVKILCNGEDISN